MLFALFIAIAFLCLNPISFIWQIALGKHMSQFTWISVVFPFYLFCPFDLELQLYPYIHLVLLERCACTA